MKNVIIAAIAGITLMGTVGIVTSANADGMHAPKHDKHVVSDGIYGYDALSFGGGLDYKFDAEAFEGDLGAKYRVGVNTQLMAVSYFSDTATTSLQVDSYRLGVEHDLNGRVQLEAYAEMDDDFNHTDTVVGIRIDY